MKDRLTTISPALLQRIGYIVAALLLVVGLAWAGRQFVTQEPAAPEPTATLSPTSGPVVQIPTASAPPSPPPPPTPTSLPPSPIPTVTQPPAPPTTPPKPTATPYPPIPTPGSERVIEKVTKMGVGVYSQGGNFMRYETFKAKPGVILLMDPDLAFIKEVRHLFPKAIIIGRRNWWPQPLDNPRQRGEAYADFVAEQAVPAKGLVDAWCSYNEPVAKGDFNGYRAWNEFQVAFAERLRDKYGIDAVAGNDAPAAIDIHEYPQYFAGAIRASKYFGIHAYTSQKATTFNEPDAQWYILRYRKIHDALEAAGIHGVKMILTEAAITEGWQQKGLNAEQMGVEYWWLADQVNKDDYMVGFAAYGLFINPGQWRPYQLAGTNVLPMLGAYPIAPQSR